MYNMASDLNEDIVDNNYKWTSISSEPRFLVGREALTIAEQNKYLLRYPIKYGLFNNEYSYQSVLDDLTKIIDFCIVQVLKINRKEFQNYNIVLLIPDLFIRQQVKGLINIFLRTMSFKSIFVHLESVMSCFGGALQSSCVVDIGGGKINICCVDEGMIIEETLIRKNIGGDNITKLLYLMLSRKSSKDYFPFENFDLSNPYHFRIIEKMKENECEIFSLQNPTTQLMPKNSKLWLNRKNNTTRTFNVTLSEALYFAPLGFFYPEIFDSIRNISIPTIDYYNDLYNEVYIDPEDIMYDLIQSLISSQAEEKKKDDGSVINIPQSNKKEKEGSAVKYNKDAEMDDSISVSHSRSDENSSQCYDGDTKCKIIYIILAAKKNTYENMFQLVNLEDMICQSIMAIKNPELRKKTANAILLVGGGSKFKGLIDYVEDRLIDKLSQLDPEIDRVEVINYPTVDPKTLGWIGGTIIPKIDATKDMWINRERWLGEYEKVDEPIIPKENLDDAKSEIATKEKAKKKDRHLDGGVKLLREKSPFQW